MVNLISSLTAVTSTATSAADEDLAGLGADFDSFLTLLTTQLKYQDPLEPMNSTEFVNQLVQFTGVEQSIATNDKLEQLIALQSGNATTGALSYIGKTIEAVSDVLNLDGGSATITYDLASNAETNSIIIVDSGGTAVATAQGETTTGAHTFVWDGLDNNGSQLPDGAYRFVVVAQDSNNQKITTTTGTIARVTGVESTADGILLSLGSAQVPVTSVKSIHETSPSS